MASGSIPGMQAPQKKSRLWRFVKRVLIGIVLLLVCAALAGAAYQAIANWRDGRRFPQEGRSIALGAEFPGVSLSMNCVGQGSPTVILDTGLGVPAAGWDLVMPDVAKFARVCSYDRAGYGWSSAGPMPRTSDEIVKELHALLAASGEKGPFVLVGHSFGGYNVRVYVGKYPADVAGLVLVDASQEDQQRLMSPSLKKLSEVQIKQLDSPQARLMPILVFFGIMRLTAGDDSDGKLSKGFRDKMKYLHLQTKSIDSTFSEIKSFSQSADEVRHAGNLGDRPLVVLTAGKDLDPKDMPGISSEDLQEFHKVWVNDLQVREARLSTRGKQVVVPDSAHMIPWERPDAVVNAIRAVCDAVKAGPGPKN